MGMFDSIWRCDYPLPDPEIQNESFQTKSLECALDSYRITEDGRLVVKDFQLESNPNYKGLGTGTGGIFNRIELGEVEVPYHGDIYFYTYIERVEYGYVARFTNGRVEWIKRANERGEVAVSRANPAAEDAQPKASTRRRNPK
jgi:hypothetical protein